MKIDYKLYTPVAITVASVTLGLFILGSSFVIRGGGSSDDVTVTNSELVVGGAVIDNPNPEPNPNPYPSSPLSRDNLIAFASQLGVNQNDFTECLDSGRYSSKVDDSFNEAFSKGITGTPAGFAVTKDGSVYEIVGGAQPYSEVKRIVDHALGVDTSTGVTPSSTIPIPISGDDHIFGNKNADVIIVEYSDFECPFCQQFHPTLKQIVADYDGQVAWAYRHLPLESLGHVNAKPAAEASECVAELGGNDAFWQYTNLLFGTV